MTQSRAAMIALVLLVGACLDAERARAQSLIATPGTTGDQLLFFYDATAGHAPFLVVSNVAPVELTLEIAWYSQSLSQRLATQVQTLAIGANVILDPSQVPSVNGNAGLTVVTPVVSATDARPVVPPPLNDTLPSAASGALAGGFTLADLSTNSAFGQNPLARLAVDADGRRAAAGSVVDGIAIRYQRIAPDTLLVPFYFNPATPQFANRLILGAFEDLYGAGGFSIGPISVDLGFGIIDANGEDVFGGQTLFNVNGVAFTDVQSLAAATPLTSSGKILFGSDPIPLPANANLIGLMSQSLGTFAVGQGLPGYFVEQRTPEPTPSATPGPPARFVDNGDGTVSDLQTGLQWEQKVAGGSGENHVNPHDVHNIYGWTLDGTKPTGSAFTDFLVRMNGGAPGVGNCVSSDASTQTGGFAGHCDWRLPTIGEFQTIIDTTRPGCGSSAPCLDPIFGATLFGVYWSATTSASDDGFAFIVNFFAGSTPTFIKTSVVIVGARAVRGGS